MNGNDCVKAATTVGVLIQLIGEPLHAHSRQPLALVGVTRVLAKQDDQERALEVLALVVNHRFGWQMANDQAAPLIAELEAELPPDVVAAAQEHGRARDLDATVAELLDELGETGTVSLDQSATSLEGSP